MHLRKRSLLVLALFAVGCAHGQHSESPSPSDPQPKNEPKDEPKNEVEEMRTLFKQLSSRLDALDARVGAMNERLTETQSSVEKMTQNSGGSQPKKTPLVEEGVNPPASLHAGASAHASTAASDPESGFSHDEAVASFRQAMVIYRASRFPEAILAFSAFLERYADHILAGSAQFYLAECYFKQKEYRLAAQEFGRELSAYDHGAHLAETLRDLAASEDQIQQPDEAARHRQLLSSLFAQSPAAIARSEAPAAPGAGVEPAAKGASDDAGKSAAPSVSPPPKANAPSTQLDPPPDGPHAAEGAPTAPLPNALAKKPLVSAGLQKDDGLDSQEPSE